MNHESLKSHYCLWVAVGDHCWSAPDTSVWSLSRHLVCAMGQISGIRTPLLFGCAVRHHITTSLFTVSEAHYHWFVTVTNTTQIITSLIAVIDKNNCQFVTLEY